jgi:hypothetical protein
MVQVNFSRERFFAGAVHGNKTGCPQQGVQFAATQVPRSADSSQFPGDLVKAGRFEDDLCSCVANDIAREFLAIDDQAGIPHAGRDVRIRHLAKDERAAFFRCNEISEVDSTKILNQATGFHIFRIRTSERQRVSLLNFSMQLMVANEGRREDEVRLQAILLSAIASKAAARREAPVRTWFHVVQPLT